MPEMSAGPGELPRLPGALRSASVSRFSLVLVLSFSLAASSFFTLKVAEHFGFTLTAPSVGAQAAGSVQSASGGGTIAPPVSEAGPVAIPSPTLLAAGTVKLPILMYHYVRIAPAGDTLGFNLSVTPTNFVAQMTWLRDHGYTTVTMHDAVRMIEGEIPMPAKPIALTFDDGYRDFYTAAAPVLKSLGLTGTNFIPTRLIGLPAYMTWQMVQQLDSEGFEMAAHTEFHVALKGNSPARVDQEVFGSRDDLQSHLGHPVLDFAYPYGSYDNAAIAVIKEAGFESAVTTNPGMSHDPSQLYVLTRVRVGGGEGIDYWSRTFGGS